MTAAEALEEVLARMLSDSWAVHDQKTAAWEFLTLYGPVLRAALSPKGHKWSADGETCVICGAKDWMGGPCLPTPALSPKAGEVEKAAMFLNGLAVDTKLSVEVRSELNNAARLLRATQSNGHSPEVRSALEPTGENLGCSPAAQAGHDSWENGNRHQTAPAGESPTPSAPAQEPVATLHDDGYFTWKSNDLRLRYERQRAGWRMDVYAYPQPDEARALLREAANAITRDDITGIYERIRAFLEGKK